MGDPAEKKSAYKKHRSLMRKKPIKGSLRDRHSISDKNMRAIFQS